MSTLPDKYSGKADQVILKFESGLLRRASAPWLTLTSWGFGLPDKPAWHAYNLMEQADIVQRMVADAELRPLTERAAAQLKKLDTAVASSGDAEVARFW